MVWESAMSDQTPQDIRWVQRFHNFQKSLLNLEQALQLPELDLFQRAGLVQFFEMTFELGWNTLKDYMEEQGVADVATPRAVLKKAYELGLISDGRAWLKGLEDRNLTSHTYNETTAEKVVALIRDQYAPLFQDLRSSLGALRP
jgi:nucleotidyltransferase substrate binding protein (TIGR01987 family)